MRVWLRTPALHFLVIGGLLFAGESLLRGGSRADERDSVVISAARVEQVRQSWRSSTGRLPGDVQLAGLLQAEIDDALLLRAARELDLQHHDPVVRRRLVQNLRFVGEGDPESGEESDEALFQQALALGMDRSDTVVRRRLIQRMKLLAKAQAVEPTARELADHLALHADRYRKPEQVRLSHVYLSRDRRGDGVEADARRLLGELRRDGTDPEAAAERGDPFLLRHQLPLQSQRELARALGPEFAEQAFALETGSWQGPVDSSYGLHLVWLHEREPSRPASIESVESEIRDALLHQREQETLARELERLRQRYRVVVEGVNS